ncbi:MAG: cyclic nucleotide-binding domain-containing protein [Deltaproteobacteria bacterium]|jgi:PAS domain S-box-containing protein|nr:cyclic nucleotide-binding domain-containing protein [Deltaproteobacteria bacterium]
MDCLRIDDIINNPDLARYLTTFNPGQTLFLEGDDTQDLYVLVSGQVEIFKGDQKIRNITEEGSFFGEVSFFLGDLRTASVKAKTRVEVICIPKEEINLFLKECPTAGPDIIRHLSQWLNEATQMLYGLKQVSDQLPDAVIMTDRDGRILVWNSAAERLYGRDWPQMRGTNVDEIYVNPQEYNAFLKEVQTQYSTTEKIFDIKHPRKGIRCISTSFTVIYDGHHNFQGVLSLGRDVTATKKLEKKYKRAFIWLVSALALIGLLTAIIFWGYPYYSKGHQAVDTRQKELINLLAKDYVLLNSWLTDPLRGQKTETIHQVMQRFFKIQQMTAIPYTGLVLLDTDRKVVGAYSARADSAGSDMIGSSYAAIDFQGSEDSLHKVLTVYRTEKNHPMGKKGTEVAFELYNDNAFKGWLIFQMDMEALAETYGIDENNLKNLQFDKP